MGGSRSTKNKLENLAGVSKDGSGRSGADLTQAALLNIAKTSAGAGKDGARLEQLAASSTITIS